jgi:hypothetical protein
MSVSSVKITADPALTDEEIAAVVGEEIRLWQERGKQLGAVSLTMSGDEIVVEASEKSPIRRVRRITGYLSTLEQFNSAKRSECGDRIEHN